jgi:hypothetical protein
MKKQSEVTKLLETFTAALEVAIGNDVRKRIINLISGMDAEVPTRINVAAMPAIKNMNLLLSQGANERLSDSIKKVKKIRKPNSLTGTKIPLRPCPVTGVPNKHRRFSYLMPGVRTPENIEKYRRGDRRIK